MRKWNDMTPDEQHAMICQLVGSYEAREGLRGRSACSCVTNHECVYCRALCALDLDPYRPPIAIYVARK